LAATTGVPRSADQSVPPCGLRGLPLITRREPKPEPGPSTATGRVKRPCQKRSGVVVS
jgi:hypothetical protein